MPRAGMRVIGMGLTRSRRDFKTASICGVRSPPRRSEASQMGSLAKLDTASYDAGSTQPRSCRLVTSKAKQTLERRRMNPESMRQLIANCRRASGRGIGFPHQWTPHAVELPQMPGFYYSDVGAWELVAENLERGHEYEELVLTTPSGALAIAMNIRIDPNRVPLYVKVQLCTGNRTLGRSFHYSNFS